MNCHRKAYIVALLTALTARTSQYCYELRIQSLRVTDTPDYRFELTLHDNQTLSSITRVMKDIPVPMWHILLLQQHNHKDNSAKSKTNKAARNNMPTVLYNSTNKVCEFARYMRRVKGVFASIPSFLFNGGNMSLDCPLVRGVYVMNNMRVPPDTPVLKFVYWPNTIYTMTGTILAQLPGKRSQQLGQYSVNGTIHKKC